jgi:short-subunit dehydrogenase
MKNVIITGSSRGIGFELVKIFSENDFNVITLSRNIEPISDLNLKNVKSYYLDISIPDSITKATSFIKKRI